jgi:hypothetical protein
MVGVVRTVLHAHHLRPTALCHLFWGGLDAVVSYLPAACYDVLNAKSLSLRVSGFGAADGRRGRLVHNTRFTLHDAPPVPRVLFISVANLLSERTT